MLVKEKCGRAGISEGDTMALLQYGRGEESFRTKNMKAMRIFMFCFSLKGGTTVALWPINFHFDDNFVMTVKPDDLKRSGTDCTKNPGARPYVFCCSRSSE